MHPRIPLAFLATRARCWLMVNLSPTRITMSLSTELLPSRSNPDLYWCMGMFLPRCRTLCLPLLNFIRFLSAQLLISSVQLSSHYEVPNPCLLLRSGWCASGILFQDMDSANAFFDGDRKCLLHKTEKRFAQAIANPLCSCAISSSRFRRDTATGHSSIYSRLRQACSLMRSRKEQCKLQRLTKLGLYIILGTGSPGALHPLV